MPRSQPEDASADRAVSPVIGVILMVAITVILATMVGSVFLDFAGQISEQPPQAAFEYEFEESENVTITHVSGDRIDNESVRITVNGEMVFPADDNEASEWDDPILAGDTVTINGTDKSFKQGDSIRIIWENPSTGSAHTLDSREWQ